MKTFILIMVIGWGPNSGKTTVQQEFNTLQQCESSFTRLSSQLKNGDAAEVEAGGCFENDMPTPNFRVPGRR